jgi:hypothetical protein
MLKVIGRFAMNKRSIRLFTLSLFLLASSGCASFGPSGYLNSSALGTINPDRGFCVIEKTLDPRRINASNTIEKMFTEAGYDTSCGENAYAVEWIFEVTDQRVDHSHLPTFCSGYGYWRSCSGGQGATFTTYQRSFRVVLREISDVVELGGDGVSDERQGAVWVASVDSRGPSTDYLPMMPQLMTPVLASLGQNHENTVMRLVKPAQQ